MNDHKKILLCQLSTKQIKKLKIIKIDPPILEILLPPAVTVGETEGAMDSTSGFFLPLLLPITL